MLMTQLLYAFTYIRTAARHPPVGTPYGRGLLTQDLGKGVELGHRVALLPGGVEEEGEGGEASNRPAADGGGGEGPAGGRGRGTEGRKRQGQAAA